MKKFQTEEACRKRVRCGKFIPRPISPDRARRRARSRNTKKAGVSREAPAFALFNRSGSVRLKRTRGGFFHSHADDGGGFAVAVFFFRNGDFYAAAPGRAAVFRRAGRRARFRPCFLKTKPRPPRLPAPARFLCAGGVRRRCFLPRFSARSQARARAAAS